MQINIEKNATEFARNLINFFGCHMRMDILNESATYSRTLNMFLFYIDMRMNMIKYLPANSWTLNLYPFGFLSSF